MNKILRERAFGRQRTAPAAPEGGVRCPLAGTVGKPAALRQMPYAVYQPACDSPGRGHKDRLRNANLRSLR